MTQSGDCRGAPDPAWKERCGVGSEEATWRTLGPGQGGRAPQVQRLGDLSLSRRTSAWSNWRVVLGSTGLGMRLSASWGWVTEICHLFLACLQVCRLPIFPNPHTSWVSCPSTHYLFTVIPGSDNTRAHALTHSSLDTDTPTDHLHSSPLQTHMNPFSL